MTGWHTMSWGRAMANHAVAPADSFAPPVYDVVWSTVPLVLLAVMIIGLVSLARRSADMPGLESFLWILLVIALPILGTVLWFSVGRGRYPRTSDAPSTQHRPLK